MVLSGVPRKKSPVIPPGIDPGTVRLVAQRLNHYATPGPNLKSKYEYYPRKEAIFRRIHFACWTTTRKSTNTHSEYVILLAFARRQRRRQHATVLRLYVHCLSYLFLRSIRADSHYTSRFRSVAERHRSVKFFSHVITRRCSHWQEHLRHVSVPFRRRCWARMFDVTEWVWTGLYLLYSDNVNSLTSPPLYFECLLATSVACFFFRNGRKINRTEA